MKNNLKIISIVLISLFLITGCKEVPKLKNGEEAVMSFKDDFLISVDEVYEQIKNNYALETIISMADKYIFETEFKEYSETAKELSENYVDQMIESYGSESEFLVALQQHTTYSTIEAYSDYVYLSNLQNYAASEYSKNNITDKQIKKFYKDKVNGDIELSHILITPNVSASGEQEEIDKAKKEALKKAEGILKELKDAKKDKLDINKLFKELVEKHSEDQSSKDKDGSLGKINNYDSLPTTYDDLITAAYELKDGEFSSKVITTEIGYHIILKTKSYEKESLEDLTETIREILGEQMLAADMMIALDALKYYRNLYELDIVDPELNKQYKTYFKNLEKNLEAQIEAN